MRKRSLLIMACSWLAACTLDESVESTSTSTSELGVLPSAWTTAAPFATYSLTYPAVVRPIGPAGDWLMFVGGFSHLATPEMLATTPSGTSGHIRYPLAQEEIWVRRGNPTSDVWSPPAFALGILPTTVVPLAGNRTYAELYPRAFATACGGFQGGQCNVQINDPTVVKLYDPAARRERHYLYFSILENWRWYDGSLGALTATGPTNPSQQNRHAIGLATSDDGRSWTFQGKVLTEDPPRAALGNGTTEPVLGAWAPSAVAVGPYAVDLYFHDAWGTKQYVAHLSGGVTLTGIDRLNRGDQTYRVNLDVVKRGDLLEVVYNDATFGIRHAAFTGPADFSTAASTTLVAPTTELSPTPNLVMSSTVGTHLYYWGLSSPGLMRHRSGAAPPRVVLPLSGATSNNVLSGWPAAAATDGSDATSYSSNYSPTASNGAYLAAWLPLSRAQRVNQVVLTARRWNNQIQAFPLAYDLYLTSPDNTRWDRIGSYTTQPDATGKAIIDLGNDYWTYGLAVIPTALGADSYGNRYFQMAEMALAY